jgi:uncharacterized protein (TIGR00725 family)
MPAYVAVVGPGDADEATCAAASAVGELLARRHLTVLTGGLGGVMAAAAAAATAAGGIAVGLLPGLDRVGASPHTVLLPTGLGEMRNALLVRCADGVIAVGGSWGTLSEVALAQRTGVPVVCLRGWSITDAAGSNVPLRVAASPAEAVDTLLALLS